MKSISQYGFWNSYLTQTHRPEFIYSILFIQKFYSLCVNCATEELKVEMYTNWPLIYVEKQK